MIIVKEVRVFLKNFKSPIINKRKLVDSLAKRYYGMMKKTFLKWRVQTYQEQLKHWQRKLAELGS